MRAMATFMKTGPTGTQAWPTRLWERMRGAGLETMLENAPEMLPKGTGMWQRQNSDPSPTLSTLTLSCQERRLWEGVALQGAEGDRSTGVGQRVLRSKLQGPGRGPRDGLGFDQKQDL